MRIGFDFDKVFVNYPPLVPNFVIDRLYKKKSRKLTYRIPGSFERKIRILSHHPLFRPPIRSNITALTKIHEQKKHTLYLISSRFSFLRDKTQLWLKIYYMDELFDEIYFNFDDEQPHLFKNRMLSELKIDMYVDDDLDLLRFLAQKNSKKKFYWLRKQSFFLSSELPDNVIEVTDIEEIRQKYL